MITGQTDETSVDLRVGASHPIPPAVEALDLDHWVRRAARGDEDAFAQVYDLTSPAVYGLALRMLVDPVEAQTSLHGVYLAIWTRLPSADLGEGSTRGTVMAVAHAHLVDLLREGRGCYQSMHQKVSLDVEDPSTTRLMRALAELPAVQREALMLTYFGGLRRDVMAEMIAGSVEVVDARIRDGLIGLLRSMASP